MKENYSKIFEIEANLDIPTLNKWARMHYHVRNKCDSKYQEAFSYLLTPFRNKFTIQVFEIEVYSNRNDDVDNSVLVAKIFVDALRKSGMILNDTRKYYKGCYLGIDKNLPRKHFRIVVKGIFTEINK
jgi:hypothetical protein